MFQGVVPIVEGCFSLKRQKMKHVENVKGECHLQPIKRARKPAGSKKLHTARASIGALAEGKIDLMDATSVDDHKMFDAKPGIGT